MLTGQGEGRVARGECRKERRGGEGRGAEREGRGEGVERKGTGGGEGGRAINL